MNGIMLDTVAFNDLVDGRLPFSHFRGYKLVATHVQADEIAKTSNEARRSALASLFASIIEEKMPTSTAVWDDSRWDGAKWSDGQRYEKMLRRLEELDGKSGKRVRFPNQSRDIRIAETAIDNGLLLFTRDRNLIQVMSEFGGGTFPPINSNSEP